MIYAIQAEGTPYIKFGVAADVSQRLASLQTGCPHELKLLTSCLGDTPEEAFIHWTLIQAKAHVRGEWFKDCAEAQEIIQAIRDDNLRAKPAPTKQIQMANRRLRIPDIAEQRQAYIPRLKRELPAPLAVLAHAQPCQIDPIAARREERRQWWLVHGMTSNLHSVKSRCNATSEDNQCVA